MSPQARPRFADGSADSARTISKLRHTRSSSEKSLLWVTMCTTGTRGSPCLYCVDIAGDPSVVGDVPVGAQVPEFPPAAILDAGDVTLSGTLTKPVAWHLPEASIARWIERCAGPDGIESG